MSRIENDIARALDKAAKERAVIEMAIRVRKGSAAYSELWAAVDALEAKS